MSTTGDPLEVIAGALHPSIGERVRDGTAEVLAFAVPGLPPGAVWRVRVTSLDHPVGAYVGVWPNGPARVLGDVPEAFLDLAASWGVHLADADAVLGYVLAFLEVTRGPAVIVQPIERLEDIPWRPGSTAEDFRRAAFLEDAPVRPLLSEPEGDRFHVEVWLVVDQRIQLNTFEVERDGSLAATFRVIADNLPLPIAR